MVEVPAAALMAETLAAEVDFLSIGTNDLVQYTMAAERGNAGVARLSDPVHPAVLRLIARVARAGRAGGARVAVCGEAASDPAAVPLLVGLGVDELSVAPRRVPIVKEWVRGLDRSAAEDLAARALGARGGRGRAATRGRRGARRVSEAPSSSPAGAASWAAPCWRGWWSEGARCGRSPARSSRPARSRARARSRCAGTSSTRPRSSARWRAAASSTTSPA